MTWNIENFPASSSSADKIAQILAAHPVDLVAAEEIDDSAPFLALASGMTGYEALLGDDPGYDTQLGLLYRADRLAQLGGTYIPLESFIDHMLVTHPVEPYYEQGTVEVLALDQDDPSYEGLVSDDRPLLAHFQL